MLKVAFLISDEGYGHVVRQREIIRYLLKNVKNIKIKVFTSKKLFVLKETFGTRIEYADIYNNIHTRKNGDGSLNVKETKKIFYQWRLNSKQWMKKMKIILNDFDFFISDCVPEAFELASILKKKCFGISHFTWDWFFENIIKDKKNASVDQMKYYMSKATHLYFPPFTNENNLQRYNNNYTSVNFIVKKFRKEKKKTFKKKKKCLIMDNGNLTMNKLISKTVNYLPKIDNIIFTIRIDNLDSKTIKKILEAKNILPIRGLKKTHSEIVNSDFIIARGGFNTISECLTNQIPAIFFDEKNNPEIKDNLNSLKKLRLSTSMKFNDWGKHIQRRLKKYFLQEEKFIIYNLKKYKFNSNGANQVCKDILRRIK